MLNIAAKKDHLILRVTDGRCRFSAYRLVIFMQRIVHALFDDLS